MLDSIWALRNLSGEQRSKQHLLRTDILVYFYDPTWNLFWGSNAGALVFVQPGKAPLEIKAGQMVRLDGVVDPSGPLALAETRAQVLSEPGLPAPLEIKDRLTDTREFDGRVVTLDGVVDAQTEPDAVHLRLTLTRPGRGLTATILVDESAPIPQWQGARIQATGVLISSRSPDGSIQGIDLWIPGLEHVSVLGWPTSDPAALHLPKLRLTSQVNALAPARALEGYPVQLHGVVTWSDPARSEFYLADAVRGITVQLPASSALRPPTIANLVTVCGRSSYTKVAPCVIAETLDQHGQSALPTPVVATIDQALTGAYEAQRLECTGQLRNVRTDGPFTVLDLTTPAGNFTARLAATPTLNALQGTAVRVAGVCVASVDDHQIDAVELLVAAPENVRPLEDLKSDGPPVLRSVSEFYKLSASTTKERPRIQLDAHILFYDSAWNLLWAEESGEPFFLQPGYTPLPIKAGQRARIQGLVTPQGGLAIDDLSAVGLENVGFPPPKDTAGHFAEAARFNQKIVTAEGYVDSQVETDSSHLRLSLIVEGRSVSVTIQLEEGSPVPQLQGAIVRLQGLYVATRYPDGGIESIDLWVPQSGTVQICGWLGTDPRFAQPVVALERIPDLPADSLVKVRGVVRRIDAGHSFVLGASDTEISVQTPQSRGLRLGMQLEAIGYVGVGGLNHFLRDALWRPSETAASDQAAMPTEHRPKLRQAFQVLELPPDQARLGYPVELRGVVIWSAPGDRCFYLRDPSRSIAVRIPLGTGIIAPSVGSSLVVKGHSAIGSFAPEVTVDQLERHGTLALPDPRIVTLEQALTGTEESQRIELTGFLRNLREDTAGTVLDLTSSTGEFTARVPAGDYLREMFGSVVRVDGVCVARVNDRRQLLGVELLVASSDDVRLEETAPANPFDVPAKSIASLRAYGPPSTLGHLVRTSGVVLQHVPGRYLVIQDADEALQVLSRSPTPLQIGARVDVVGFPGREGGRINLREGLYRQTGSGPEPEPDEVRAADAASPERDGHLVRMVATLLDIERTATNSHLLLQDGRTTFGATLHGLAPGPSLGAPGSTLAVRGICRVQFDEYHQPRSFELELRSANDVVVLARPAWWTIDRALAAAGGLALCSLLVMLWVALLRRRVQQQTATIRTQLEQQTVLEKELQRASKLESLGVLAGGIAHDFNNLLTIILCNVSLAQTNTTVVAAVGECLRDAERGARRARSLTMQLLTFAKGGDPLRSALSLAEIVRESAGFVLRGSTVGCDFDFAHALWAADADRDQIGQVVHNLVLNATQAMPNGGRVHIALTNERLAAHTVDSLPAGRYVRLTVADTGSGIPAELLTKIFDPYFSTKKAGSGLGLATVYSIVRKHKGHIGVNSEPGKGSTFQVWLPAANETPAPALADEQQLPAPPSPRLKGRRILAMDDDEDIRHLLVATLRRFEFEVEAVRDGDEAVHLYAEERAAGRPFDLVIMDLTVPGGTGGLEAMEQLRKIDPSVYAIVCSGYSNAPVLANFRAYGFCAMVSKPYEVDELTGAVTRVLAERDAKSRESKG